MSNSGGYEPYGGNPYGGGTPPPPPGGPTPYGAPPAGGNRPATDGVSIGSLVTALLCCTAPVAVVLGIIGIVRTAGGQRTGRWMAVTGLVLGVLGTLAIGATVAGIAWFGTSVVFEDEAEVGQCVNTSSLSDANDLWQAECDEDHDAEIFAVVTMEANTLADLRERSEADFCALASHPDYLDLLGNPDYRIDFATDAIDDDVDWGDTFVCFLERADGAKMTAPLVGSGSTDDV